jgi:thymidylate synthase
MHTIEGETANEIWLQALSLLTSSSAAIAEGRGGPTREVLHVTCNVRNPLQHWVIGRTPAINPAYAIADVVWIVNGREDSHFVNFWNSQLPKFAGTAAKYDGAYGNRLRKHFGIDQIRRVCDALSSDSTNRQAVLQLWDPVVDLPDSLGRPASPDVPCNICALLKVRNNKLEWTQIMRSNDLVLGLPYDFVEFTFLHEIVAGFLGVSLGEYCHFADSLHMYQRDVQKFKAVSLEPEPNTDRLDCPLELTDRYFREASNVIESLEATTCDHFRIVVRAQVPNSYRNLLLIMAAEAARRRKLPHEIDSCLNECTNPSLVQVYRRWLSSRTTPGHYAAEPQSRP